jgi:Zn-dependent protease with chaperone function
MAHHIVSQCRHRKEKIWGVFMIGTGLVIWIGLAGFAVSLVSRGRAEVVVVYILYAIAGALFVIISAALVRANAFGNHVLLGDNQFPHLYKMLAEGARELGFDTPPRAFLYNSNGVTNAFARRLLRGRYVFLTSALVQANTDAQIRFVIGHELGHHAAGHLDWRKNLLKLPGRLVPFLYPAYSRGRELTCDRIGVYLSGDLEASCSALQMLACGCARLNSEMSIEAFTAQEDMVAPVAGWFVNLFATHPRITRRVREIGAFASSMQGRAERRTQMSVGPATSPAE